MFKDLTAEEVNKLEEVKRLQAAVALEENIFFAESRLAKDDSDSNRILTEGLKNTQRELGNNCR